MRIALAMACAVLVACGAAAPPATQTASVRVTSSAPAAITAAQRYVAVGASDSVGVGARDPASGSWPARLAARLPPGSTFVNVAVSGSRAADAIGAQLPRAIRERPTLVTVWLAVNDISAQIPPEQYARDLGSVIEGLALGSDARIFVGNVPDLRAVPAFSGADPVALKAVVDAYNSVIAGLVTRHGTRVVAVDLLRGSAELTSSLTVTEDGLHPTDRGYELIAERFAEHLRAAGYALR